MSRYPTGRPTGPTPPRPGAPAPGAVPSATIDPVKLLRKYKTLLVGAFVFSIVVGVGAFLLLRTFMPRYTAMVIYQAYPAEFRPEMINPTGLDRDEIDRFMLTQVATMTSDVVYSDVIASEGRLLNEAPLWVRTVSSKNQIDRDKALESLRDSVSASIVPETYFIRMRASAGDRVSAAALAKLCREAYLNRLGSASRADIADRRDTLTQQMDQLDRSISDLSSRRARIVRDEELDTINANQTEARANLIAINTQLLQVSQTIEAVEVQLTRFDEMLRSPTGIVYTDTQRAQAERDPIVAGLRQQIRQAEASRLSLQQQGLQPGHLTMRQIDSQIAGLEQKMADERETKLREIFDAEVDGTRRTMGQLRAQEAQLVTDAERYRQELNDLTRILSEVGDLDDQIKGMIAQRADASARLGTLESQAGLERVGRIGVQQLETVPSEMSFPRIVVILPLSVLLICGLTGGGVVLRELLDQRVKSAADVAMIPRTRVAGSLPIASEDPTSPKRVETAFVDEPRGVLAESYRQLRTGLLKAMNRAGHRSLVVAAGMPGSGATSVVTNLGLACAAMDQRVLLIDGNFRRPALHRVFGLDEHGGLAEVLAGSRTLAEAVRTTDRPGLDVLTAGGREHRVFERLGTEAMASLLTEAADEYDLILIDVAPCVVSGDAMALANRADASVLVVRAMKEKRGMVARIKNELSESRAEFLGVVVNAVRSAAGGYMRVNIRTSHDYQAAEETDGVPATRGA